VDVIITMINTAAVFNCGFT